MSEGRVLCPIGAEPASICLMWSNGKLSVVYSTELAGQFGKALACTPVELHNVIGMDVVGTRFSVSMTGEKSAFSATYELVPTGGGFPNA